MNLKYLILKSLSRCHGYLLPEKILIAEVMGSSRATEAEAKLAISESETDGFIAGATNPLDGQHRWALTDLGTVTLAQF